MHRPRARLADAGTAPTPDVPPELEIQAMLHRESTLEATFEQVVSQAQHS